MLPPGLIISCPDSAISMHSHIRRTRKHKNSLIRTQTLESFPCCTCHVISKQIMHLIMTDHFSVHIMIKLLKIIRIICQASHQSGKLLESLKIQILIFQFGNGIKGFIHSVLCKENRRFIHIIPESFNSLIQQYLIFISKPLSGIFVQHIRKMNFSGPHTCNKFFSVFLFAEITFLYALFVHLISFFYLYTGVNDRYQMNMLFFHLLYKFREIRKTFLVDSKIFKAFHIINIHINTFQWNMIFSVLFHYLADIFFIHIAPAALLIAKRPFWRDIASSNQLPELLHNRKNAVSCNYIHICICFFQMNHNLIQMRISDIKSDNARIIEEHSECFFSTVKDKDIMRSIEGMSVFYMCRFICTTTFIKPSSFVDSTYIFSQTIYFLLVFHRVEKFQFPIFLFHLQKREYTLLRFHFINNSIRLKGLSVSKFCNHFVLLLFFNFIFCLYHIIVIYALQYLLRIIHILHNVSSVLYCIFFIFSAHSLFILNKN